MYIMYKYSGRGDNLMTNILIRPLALELQFRKKAIPLYKQRRRFPKERRI